MTKERKRLSGICLATTCMLALLALLGLVITIYNVTHSIGEARTYVLAIGILTEIVFGVVIALVVKSE